MTELICVKGPRDGEIFSVPDKDKCCNEIVFPIREDFSPFREPWIYGAPKAMRCSVYRICWETGYAYWWGTDYDQTTEP